MKNLTREFIFGRNAKVSAFFVLGIFLLVGLGCFGSGRSDGSNSIPPAYFGDWTGTDGSTLSIRADGKGDYRSGNTKVDGGSVEVDEAAKELSVTFIGIGPTLKIDSSPSGDEMKLGGVVYRRKGEFSTLTESNKSVPTKSVSTSESKDDAPPDGEVEDLVKGTMQDFTDAVEREDFTDFLNSTSKDFQASYKADQLKDSFASFITQKDKVLPILNSIGENSAEFSSPPRVRTEKGFKILVAEGKFPTSPNTTKFETEYEWEKGNWKILKIKVRL